MKTAFYTNARGEYVMSYRLFQCLNADALAAGRLKIKEGIAS